MKLPNMTRYKNDNLIVGKGTIITSNICIPFHAISYIKIEGKKRKSIDKCVIAFIIGGVMLIIPILRFIGEIVVSCASIMLAETIFVNCFQKCSLVIQTNSGAVLVLEHPEIDFIKEVAEVIRKGLDDTTGVYYIKMKETKITQKIKGDPSFMTFGKNNQFDDSVIIIDGHKHKEEHVVDSYNNSTLFTEEEWKQLEHYFQIRAEELGEENIAYDTCKQMQKLSKEKNASELRKITKKVGKAILGAVISHATEYGVAELLRRLATI